MKRIVFPVFFAAISIASNAQNVTLTTYIQQHAKEIDPGEANFHGLSFLDTLLRNKRIVLLGESSHGTEEYSATKLRLIQYLHQKLGFRVVLFESPMSNCAYMNMATDTNAATLVKNTIQDVWHTPTVAQLFRYIKNSKMIFDGFDPQFMSSPYPALFYTGALHEYAGVKDTLLRLENRVAATIRQPGLYISLRDSFASAYEGINKRLQELPLNGAQQWLQHMMAVNNRYYTGINQGETRDACMAENIIWLAEKRFPDEKIIVWAHNTHIDKNATRPKRIMGRLLAEHFKEGLFAIGLFMVNGTTALNNRQVIPVKEAMPGSLEAILATTGFKTTFVTTTHPAFNNKIPTWHWGKDKQTLRVASSFDAVVLINRVNAPTYLSR